MATLMVRAAVAASGIICSLYFCGAASEKEILRSVQDDNQKG
jgi:hypothetical protein